MDIAMPLLNGLEATRQILKYCPPRASSCCRRTTTDAYIDRPWALGAVGYLIKQTSLAGAFESDS